MAQGDQAFTFEAILPLPHSCLARFLSFQPLIMMHAKQLCILTILAGAALYLVGCGDGGGGGDGGCTFDSSVPQQIEASYVLASKLGINTSATGAGVNASYRGVSTMNVVSEPRSGNSSLRFPTDGISEWIASIEKSLNNGVMVKRSNGAFLNVSVVDLNDLALTIGGIIRCQQTGFVGPCSEVVTTWTSTAAVWMWMVRIKNNCGTYLFNASLAAGVTTKDESKPPCCLQGYEGPTEDTCTAGSQGIVYNLCEASTHIQIV